VRRPCHCHRSDGIDATRTKHSGILADINGFVRRNRDSTKRARYPTALAFPAFVGSSTFTTGYWGGNVHLDAQPVPEPTTMVLLGSGLAAAFLRRRR